MNSDPEASVSFSDSSTSDGSLTDLLAPVAWTLSVVSHLLARFLTAVFGLDNEECCCQCRKLLRIEEFYDDPRLRRRG
jgi:hypothetical protein